MRSPTSAAKLTSVSWAAAVFALTGLTFAVALTGAPSGNRLIAAIAHALLVIVSVGVGLLVLWRRPGDRFARWLVGCGLVWAATALVQSPDPLAYSVGRVAVWVAEGLLVYLLLAFPSGRLTTAIERRTAGAMAAVIGVLFVPTALLVDHYPEPSEGSSCTLPCPANALDLAPGQPAFVDDLVRPLRETLVVAIFFVVAVILVRRARRAGPMLRRALIPVAGMAMFRALAFPIYFGLRGPHPTSGLLTTLNWVYLLALPLIPLSFGAGLVLRRLYGALALQRMALRLPAAAGVPELERAMATALEDPTLRIVDDEAGPPRPPDGREVTEVAVAGHRQVAIEHDAALAQDTDVMRAAGAYTMVVLENRRLVDRLRTSVREVSASRARIASVGDEERRRIERDLHDGAQQRLIALRLALARQGERLQESSPEAAEALEALGRDTEDTIEDIRSLAHGIYPSLLADRGLKAALHAAVLGSPIGASLDAGELPRYTPEIESTVYFACVEALQNAAKHARGATHVEISLAANRELEFAVSDDGSGFDVAELNGGGLSHLHDRLTAAGGHISIDSAPGRGTIVRGSVPVRSGRRPA